MRRAALAVATALLLTGCASGPPEYPDLERRTSNVDVDTPKLRDLKQQAGVEPCVAGDGTEVDGGLPDLTLACLGGGDDVDLASLRGPLVLNLWASSCGPCRREMPLLQAFHEDHGDEVPIVGVAWQDVQVAASMEFLVSTRATYPQLADPGGELGVIDGRPVPGLPVTVLVDEDGRVAFTKYGEVDDADELEGLVRDHLGVDL